MACQISVRDIDFHPSTKGVRVRAYTDVPSHLYLRLSEKEPWIHKKPSIRRGVAFAEDVRFCFTVYEDNEQYEPGDTMVHTWWKESWPVCTTKWLYVWGSRSGEVCVSTTAPFSYHNDGQSPLPPPRVLKTFTSIEPNFITTGPYGYWATYPVIEQVDQDAEAILIHGYYKSANNFLRWGVRPVGASGYWEVNGYSYIQRWAIVKLNAAKEFQIYCQGLNQMDFWLLGYFNSNIVLFDTLYNRVPYASGWQTVDFSDVLPATGCEALILLYGCHSGGWQSGIRAYGSSDNRYKSRRPNYAIVRNNDRKVDIYKYRVGEEANWRCALVGYFRAGASFYTNGDPIGMAGLGSWELKNATAHYPNPSLVVCEQTALSTLDPVGSRKRLGDHAWTHRTYGGSHMMTHPDTVGRFDLYREHASTYFHYLGALD